METTARGAKKVVGADSATAYREAIAANADLLAAPLLITARAANFAGKVGELALVTATATDTLPAPSANAIHGVFTTAGITTIVAGGAVKIYGGAINGAGSMSLVVNQHVTLQSDGANWFIIEQPSVGAWEKLQAISGKLEESTGSPRVRIGPGLAVQCQGLFVANALLPEGATLFTAPLSPAQVRYSYAINASNSATLKVSISPGGVVKLLPGSELPATNALSIDTLAYTQ